jgi:TatA/E family protein of Tat protein translocase
MFGFHWLELLVILPLVALILGPKRLPALGEAVGRAIGGFRKGVAELKEVTGIDEARRSLSAGIAELKEETGIDAVRRDLRRGMSDLREESGIDEVRRELNSLDKPVR